MTINFFSPPYLMLDQDDDREQDDSGRQNRWC